MKEELVNEGVNEGEKKHLVFSYTYYLATLHV